MNESPIVAAWRAEGRAEMWAQWKAEGAIETRREDILRLQGLKFPGQVPAELEAAVEAQADPDVLARWLDALFTSSSIEEYRAIVGI